MGHRTKTGAHKGETLEFDLVCTAVEIRVCFFPIGAALIYLTDSTPTTVFMFLGIYEVISLMEGD
jgi:hypothetical protein